MTRLIHMVGDIFGSSAGAIGHGINAKGVMGAGIALQFKKAYPDMYRVYKEACDAGMIKGGGSYGWQDPDSGLIIFNICSQVEPGPNASYDLLVQGVEGSINQALWLGIDRIALPRIGSGIGGLDDDVVEAILEVLAEKTTVDIELWTYRS